VWVAGNANQATDLAAVLRLHPVFCRTRMPAPESGSGVDALGIAVLARWPIVDHQQYMLPYGHDGPRGSAPSLAHIVVLDHPDGRLNIVTACPEWDIDRADARVAQTSTLARLVADSRLDGPLPVILAGDLNARPNTPEYCALTGVLTDTWSVTHPDEPGYTLAKANRYVQADEWLADGRIDHILARPGTPDRQLTIHATMLAGTDDPPPSDHYAVVADME
jgi:endonuclease/exonuclease/phosphatase family metal-dependent hydrolase